MTEGAADSESGWRRRGRTEKYCGIWGIQQLDSASHAVPTVVEAGVSVRPAGAVRVRALIELLLGLKGQGLTQHEVFAFADAYELWDAFTVDENELVLEPAPQPQELVQAAWRYERANVFGWALGNVRHLHFADNAVDGAALLESALPGLASPVTELRSHKDLLDSADIHLLLAAICRGARTSGVAPPANLDPGVVHEREVAFDWLLGRVQ